MKKSIYRLLLPILYLFLILGLVLGVMAYVYPERYLYFTTSFISFGDSEITYGGVFTILSEIYNGGLALWNPYDLMSMSFYYLTAGVFSYANILTAFVYILLSPLFIYKGEFFHNLYSFFHIIPSLIILIFGTHLLIKRFTNNLFVIMLTEFITCTLLIPQFYLGLSVQSVYSFLPLVVHELLTIAEKRKLKDIGIFFLTMSLCVAMHPLIALGYFYTALHPTVFTVVVILIFRIIQDILKKQKIFPIFTYSKKDLIVFSFTIILGISILIAPVWQLTVANTDLDFAQSQSRFSGYNPLDFGSYFTRRYSYSEPPLITRWLDFTNNLWDYSYVFLGYTPLFLVITAFFLGKSKYRLLFIVYIIYFRLLNIPRDPNNIFSIAQWFDSITNPLNVVARSAHMVGAFLMPLYLPPLIAIALEALIKNIHNFTIIALVKKMLIYLTLIAIFVAYYPHFNSQVINYYYIGVFISFSIFLLPIPRQIQKYSIISTKIVIVLLLIIDFSVLPNYYKIVTSQMQIKDEALNGIKTVIDGQNPQILPFRNIFEADINKSIKAYLYTYPHNYQGIYQRYTNYTKFYSPADEYFSRHINFAPLSRDKNFRDWLRQSQTTINFLPSSNPVVSGVSGINTSDINEHVSQLEKLNKKTLILDNKFISEVKFNNNLVYQYKLPEDFPKWLTTSVYVNQSKYISLIIDDFELNPIQGNFIGINEFDVNNIKNGYLLFTTNDKRKLTNEIIKFIYTDEILPGMKIINFEFDSLKLNYSLNQDGYLIFNYPYDDKFNLKINSNDRNLEKINSIYFGTKLIKGDYTIELNYWKYSPLRLFLYLQMILTLIIPIILYFLIEKNIKYQNK